MIPIQNGSLAFQLQFYKRHSSKIQQTRNVVDTTEPYRPLFLVHGEKKKQMVFDRQLQVQKENAILVMKMREIEVGKGKFNKKVLLKNYYSKPSQRVACQKMEVAKINMENGVSPTFIAVRLLSRHWLIDSNRPIRFTLWTNSKEKASSMTT